MSAETGERLLAKHIASVTSCDQVSDAYGHTRTNANALGIHVGTVDGDTALKAGGRGSLRFFIYLILRPHRGPGADSASNRNEYHG